jgi:hypothetical protein
LSEQRTLFAAKSVPPEGLRYCSEFISKATEQELIGRIAALPLKPFQFGQYEGKRRMASFGFRYDYTLRRLEEAEPIPAWLSEVIERVEDLTGRRPVSDRCSAPNMTRGSASAGTATSRISTESLACRWDRHASFASDEPPAANGNASPSMRRRDRST